MNTIWLGINMAQPDKWVLPIIAGVLQFFQGRQMMPPKPKEGKSDPTSLVSAQMMYLMPVFTIFIAGRLPAALPLYWIITTIFGIGQQWWATRNKAEANKIIQFEEKAEKFVDKKVENISKTVKKGVEVTVRRKNK